MSPINKNFCLVGLPKSGKSTFVAALWHVVEAKELPDSLQVSALPHNRHYLEKIRDAWLDCNDMSRTSIDAINHINLNVTDSLTKNSAEFAFPDVKGELFKQLFETRELPLDYLQLLQFADGILLFIGDQIKRPDMISEYEDIFKDQPPVLLQPWKHQDVPTQVVLVDLVQTILEYIKKPFKLAIIISAWDKQLFAANALDEKINPQQWLKKTLPLFHQYISTNNDDLSFRCFGVSAQGGDYENQKTELFTFDLPSKRIKVQEGDDEQISHDISAPIKWLLNSL